MDAMRGLVACCERPGMILDTNTVAQLAKVRDALKQLDEFGSKVEQSHATRRSGYTTSGNGREDEKITEADQIDPTMPLQERFNLARAKAQQTAPSGVRYVTPPSVARLRAFLDEPEVDKGEPK
ncbi:hypothetical protein OKW41_006137 [Paraburkholderia sp. UCT70]|uniref:hypothetical protein n=1 Tax=Paraburkholderia sp. UCT70 TaxID=2991068 RepID=UPI003D1E082E